MGKISGIGLAFMLFASLGFAWTTGYAPTSCMTSYSVLDANFTTIIPTSCPSSTGFLQGISSIVNYSLYNSTHIRISKADDAGAITSLHFPISGNYSGTTTASVTTNKFITCSNGSLEISATGTVNFTEINATHYYIEAITGNLTCLKASNWSVAFTSSGSGVGGDATAYLQLPIWNTSTTTQLISSVAGTTINSSQYYIGGMINKAVLYSDFKTGGNILTNGAAYCQSLLYFNNPYYGNIQLIPKITYIPGVDAFANFINTSSNAAYLPNNTITYIFDNITSIWYIVPATICTSYSIVGSTSTLQYNPTATGTAVGGTVPIDVTGITGACSYNTGTRLISCTGTDTSNTVTSLSLSAYLTGNTTDLCGSTVAGASGTLTCTLPAQNGTYNVIFYGTDANLFLHSFASKTIVIGTGSSGYGRDAYIAVFLLVGVAALLLSSNIAVSMVLMCFGMFVGLAIGALPIADAPVVVFFTVIALVLAYRLKV